MFNIARIFSELVIGDRVFVVFEFRVVERCLVLVVRAGVSVT